VRARGPGERSGTADGVLLDEGAGRSSDGGGAAAGNGFGNGWEDSRKPGLAYSSSMAQGSGCLQTAVRVGVWVVREGRNWTLTSCPKRLRFIWMRDFGEFRPSIDAMAFNARDIDSQLCSLC
jgi:hypothetical protein